MNALTPEQIAQARWVPANATEHAHELGVAYSYERQTTSRHGTPITVYCALAYTKRATKASFHESYHRAESRDQRIAEFFSGLEARAAAQAKHKAERSRTHTLKPGDVLHHSWGWEQTNCDYYQVLATTAHGATIQGIASQTVEGSEYSHGMADMRVAVPNAFHGEPVKVRIDGYNRITATKGRLSHGSAGPWDGKPNYCSWYA